MSDLKNLLITICISTLILITWQIFYEKPQAAKHSEQTLEIDRSKPQPVEKKIYSREEVINSSGRLTIKNSKLHGSISLKGARIDDLILTSYRETLAANSPNVILFSPANTKESYFAEFGWISDSDIELPTAETVWTANHHTLSPNHPVTLTWVNPHNLIFSLTIKLDDAYMFSISQEVRNESANLVNLSPYGLISYGKPVSKPNTILHEGVIAVINDKLVEETYESVKKKGKFEYQDTSANWLGITDKYWLTAFILDKSYEYDSNFTYVGNDLERYQVDFSTKKLYAIEPGQKLAINNHLFAGAKKLKLLDNYASHFDIKLFDRAVDFGWFYFLTKPIFNILQYLYSLLGNFGLAILLITVFIKLIMFPLANRSYQSMNRMKRLQPQLQLIKERTGSDRAQLNREIMELYKREGINPLSGCLPLLLQIPVFFSLYKVIYITIEMRHAPFFGWIHDLSAPDPTSLFNLFGLINWTPPSFLMIGVWPLIMTITMYLQQKMSPPPTDPAQAQMMNWLPLIFMFMFSSFPAGLIIYWAWNNILSVLQQWVISRAEEKW